MIKSAPLVFCVLLAGCPPPQGSPVPGNGAIWDGTVDLDISQPTALIQFGVDILFLSGSKSSERVSFEVEIGMAAVDVATALEEAWNTSAATKMCRMGTVVWIEPDSKHEEVSYTVCVGEQSVSSTSGAVGCIDGLGVREVSLEASCP